MFKKAGATLLADDDAARIKKLAPGVYRLADAGGQFAFIPAFTPVKKDGPKLLQFTTGPVSDLMVHIDAFAKAGKKFADVGATHKTGVILHGRPGTGKTCAAMQLMVHMTKEYRAVCIDATGCHDHLVTLAAAHVRRSQDNLIVMFIDEAEGFLQREGALSFLDGSDSVDGCIFIGCTNELAHVPEKITKRPSRVRFVLEIDRLPVEVYHEFIRDKMKDWDDAKQSEIAHMVYDKGLTIDELKHALIDTHAYGTTIGKAIKGARALA